MNLLDLVILAMLGIAGVNGFRRGAALQLTAYAGLLAGLFVGAVLAPAVAGLVSSPLAQAVVAIVVLFSLAGIGDAIGWVIGSKFWTMARQSMFGVADSVAGTFVALVAVLLATWFLGFNLVNGPVPGVSRQIRSSAIIRGLDSFLPRPPSLLAEVRQFLNRFGFPEVFADLPPAPGNPVDVPRNIRGIVNAAAASTVQIVGQACGAVQEGSGFVAADHYVITNAHVVAGVRAPQVRHPSGGVQAGVTVLFDPHLDVAILYVENTPGPPLKLRSEEADRGTPGAVLGYPGGGPLDTEPAAIRRELHAVGRDIYGNSVVERNVYELQADVRPGNSGGPFVLRGGIVAGVVFAASTTEGDVGYALTSTEVIPRLRRAKTRTEPVSTDGCAR
ncbi:MAG TPA: MarP family serine protease [Actinomycetota bacterium]|nr:MarP family serine protease [Actinomycetota bacterium]